MSVHTNQMSVNPNDVAKDQVMYSAWTSLWRGAPTASINIDRFTVDKATPKGVWVIPHQSSSRYIEGKRIWRAFSAGFVWPTRKEALDYLELKMMDVRDGATAALNTLNDRDTILEIDNDMYKTQSRRERFLA